MATYEIKFFTAAHVGPNRLVVGLRAQKDGDYFQYFQGFFEAEDLSPDGKIPRIIAAVDAVQGAIEAGVQPLTDHTMAFELAIDPRTIGGRTDPLVEAALSALDLGESYGINPLTLLVFEA